jgi:fucose 4-O-acetylase-like acetyltransferase
MTTNRIEFIDLAKGFCIILVVLFHITVFYQVSLPLEFDKFFKAFRMPLYFFLSGFFFKTYDGFVSFVKKKTNKLLIPFVFWYLSLSVLLPIYLYRSFGIILEKAVNFEIIPAMTEFITRENFPNSPIWFLLCLFEVNVLFYICFLLSRQSETNKWKIMFILSFLIGYLGLLLSFIKINLPMFIDSSMTALPFFMLGYFINKKTILLQPNQYDKYIVGIILLSFLFVYFFSGSVGFKFNHFGRFSPIVLYPCGFVGTMGVIFCAKKLKSLPLVSNWGRYSIMILVTHRMVYQFYNPLLAYFIGEDKKWIIVLANLICTMLSYQLLIPIMKKYLPYVTAQKDVFK